MTKAPTPTEMSKGQSDNTNNATKKFDKTAVIKKLLRDNTCQLDYGYMCIWTECQTKLSFLISL